MSDISDPNQIDAQFDSATLRKLVVALFRSAFRDRDYRFLRCPVARQLCHAYGWHWDRMKKAVERHCKNGRKV